LNAASLQTDMAKAGFDILETGMYPAKRHSLFVVGQKAAAPRS